MDYRERMEIASRIIFILNSVFVMYVFIFPLVKKQIITGKYPKITSCRGNLKIISCAKKTCVKNYAAKVTFMLI